eukprot:CAMPEP_0206408194 /NCGR_PEP_ID=MMETSP0294-20121207/30979_1 /ASSEMBLY_ACC=CAM_ASM_000327 /TAXON_ID=39354 /ORGANISM="Heterosigma akashiwo, Strain CCMP2393" /LENGTH=55 /DNA_ID=CAMNT_0053867557 /DNA_START=301 /DNA_END=468 /DNA_ORIENTATION=-
MTVVHSCSSPVGCWLPPRPPMAAAAASAAAGAATTVPPGHRQPCSWPPAHCVTGN